MSHRMRAILIITLLLGAALLGWLFLRGGQSERRLSGYIEGDSLFLASPVAGTVSAVMAEEGERVAAGAQLFAIDPATLSAEGDQARARTAETQSRIATASANAEQARSEVAAAGAEAEHARRDLARLLAVRADDEAAVAGKDIDAARAAVREASARLAAARENAQARRTEVEASRALENAARGGEREVAIRVGQLAPSSPAAARVEQIFYRPGEWVAANQPILSLLPDDRVKLRFFVPEKQVARYRPGRMVRFSCDGCGDGQLDARISYVSARPEFTPPVIFSRDSRDRLVFMVEARPRRAANLMPGLPVDVEPLQ